MKAIIAALKRLLERGRDWLDTHGDPEAYHEHPFVYISRKAEELRLGDYIVDGYVQHLGTVSGDSKVIVITTKIGHAPAFTRYANIGDRFTVREHNENYRG